MERKELTKEEDVKVNKVEGQKDLRSYEKANEKAREVLEQVKKLYASQNESFHFTSIYGTYTINGEEFNCAYDYVGENGEKIRGRIIIQDKIKEVLGIKYNLFSKIIYVGQLIKEGKISPEIIEAFNEYGLFEKYSLTKDEQNEMPESNEEIVKDFIEKMNNLIQYNGKDGFLFTSFSGPVTIKNVKYERRYGQNFINSYLKEQFGFKYSLEKYMNVILKMENDGEMPEELNEKFEKVLRDLDNKVNKIMRAKNQGKQ